MKKIRRNEITMTNYEGALYGTEMNTYYISGREGMLEAYRKGCVVEAKTVSAGGNGSLIFNFGDNCVGFISAEEYSFTNEVKHAPRLHCVNKVMCFFVIGYKDLADGTTEFILSRREVQKAYFENYLSKIPEGKVLPAKVQWIDEKSGYADLGYGYFTKLYLSSTVGSFLFRMFDMLCKGDVILCEKTGVNKLNQVTVNHRSLLGGNCCNIDDMGIGIGDSATGMITGYNGDSSAFVSISSSACVLIDFAGEKRPPIGEVVTMRLSKMDRYTDRVNAEFTGLADRMPDFRDFTYFIPEEAYCCEESEAA